MDPIGVTVIGTGDGNKVEDGTIAQTPSNQSPNLAVRVIKPLTAIAVRFANVYLGSLLGLITAGMMTDKLPVSDFVSLVWLSAELALPGALLWLLKDVVTVFARLEGKYPLLTGSV